MESYEDTRKVHYMMCLRDRKTAEGKEGFKVFEWMLMVFTYEFWIIIFFFSDIALFLLISFLFGVKINYEYFKGQTLTQEEVLDTGFLVLHNYYGINGNDIKWTQIYNTDNHH